MAMDVAHHPGTEIRHREEPRPDQPIGFVSSLSDLASLMPHQVCSAHHLLRAHPMCLFLPVTAIRIRFRRPLLRHWLAQLLQMQTPLLSLPNVLDPSHVKSSGSPPTQPDANIGNLIKLHTLR